MNEFLVKEQQEEVIQEGKDKAVERAVQPKMQTINVTPKPKAPRKDAIDPGKMDAVGKAYADEGKTRQQVAAEFGVGENTVTRAAQILEARRQGAEEAAVDVDALPKTAKEKLKAAIRQEKRRLQAEFEQVVQQEIKKRIDEMVLPAPQKREKQYELVVKSRKGIMSREQYRLIASALHPDQSASKERLHQAFLTFTKYQLVLCAEPEIECPSPMRR